VCCRIGCARLPLLADPAVTTMAEVADTRDSGDMSSNLAIDTDVLSAGVRLRTIRRSFLR
jgi:hypothetical protein